MCSANSANNQFLALSEDVRNRLFETVLSINGLACDKVDGNVFQRLDKAQIGYWTISCIDAEFYSVQVASDNKGSISVKTCSEILDTTVPCNANNKHADKAEEVIAKVTQPDLEFQAAEKRQEPETSTELASAEAEGNGEPEEEGGWFPFN